MTYMSYIDIHEYFWNGAKWYALNSDRYELAIDSYSINEHAGEVI